MRVFLSLLFLTFVLSGYQSLAAPQTKTTLETTPLSTEPDPNLVPIDPELREESPTYLVNTSLGFSGGNYLEADEVSSGPYLAIRYLPLWSDFPTWDYQVEVNSSNLIGLSAGRRFYCCPEYDYIPYLRLSGALFLEGAGELAGFVEIRRWRFRASAGIGDTFTMEMGVGYAITGPDIFAQFGYNWGF